MVRSDRIEIKKKKLHVHRALPEDSGMYSCLAKNEAGASPKMESFPLIVSGNDTATIRVVPRDLIAKRGEPAMLHCAFDDADFVQWFFKDIGPLETDDERTVLENGTLVIRSAEHRDQGFYSCHGDRGDSSITYTVDLQIACKRCFSNRCKSRKFERVSDERTIACRRFDEPFGGFVRTSTAKPSGRGGRGSGTASQLLGTIRSAVSESLLERSQGTHYKRFRACARSG